MIKTLIKRSAIVLSLVSSTVVMADYPVGFQDHYIVRSGEDVRLEVLNNDTGDGLSIIGLNEWTVKGGKTTYDSSDRDSARRRVTYVTPTNFVGEDEFWYVLIDGQGRRNAAKVKVTVKAADSDAVNPQNDEVSVQQGSSIRIDVLQNDGVLVSSGSQNTGSIVEFNSSSQNGGSIVRADIDGDTPQLKYTPKPGFIGVDEFRYTMSNGFDSRAAMVTVNVTKNYSSGKFPVAKADNFRVKSVNRGRTVPAYYPLDNDIGNNLKVVDRQGYSQQGGTYAVSSDGKLTYNVPSSLSNRTESQQDKIWYVIEDELGRKNWGVINFTIPAFFQG